MLEGEKLGWWDGRLFSPTGYAVVCSSRRMARAHKALEGLLRLSFAERLVDALLVLTAVNLLVAFITGGYNFSVGPVRVSAQRLRNPLLFFVIFGMMKVWLGGRGKPSASL
jgi:hypothetical protein